MMDIQEQERYRVILALFHYPVAGLALLFAVVPIVRIVTEVFSLLALTELEPSLWDTSTPPFMLHSAGLLYVFIAVAWMLIGVGFSALTILTGQYLLRKIQYTYCVTMAIVESLFMPVGTVVGVLTLMYLCRPKISAQFHLTDPLSD